MSRPVFLTLASIALFACKESEPPRADAVDPACRQAESISPETRLAAATDDATPRYAVKVRGPGEVALAGFIKKHDVTIYDLGTKQVAARAKTDVCRATWVPLPTETGGYGEFCVLIEPSAPKGYSTFDLGFSAQPHAGRDAGAEERTADLCGAQK